MTIDIIIPFRDTNTVDHTNNAGVLESRVKISALPGNRAQALADGVYVPPLSADQFSTVSGQVITFASGAMLNVPVGSTLFGSTITTSDGNSFDIASVDTDTNTFATFSGTTVTFADGNSFDIASVDTDTNTFATRAGNVITFADGSTLDVSSVDTNTFSEVSGQTITFASGATLDVPVGSTLAGRVITTSDGNSIDLDTLDTDDQIVASADSSILVASTTAADGQVNYNIRTEASVIPAVDPTGMGGTTVDQVAANLYSQITGLTDIRLASAPLVGEMLNLTLNNGTVIPADLSAFATDAALAAQIAAVVAAEEHAENITVAANGDVTVLDNNGAQIGPTFNTNNVTPGTYALSGTGPTAVPLVNGGVLNIDSSGLATDADVAAAVAGENFLLQPTISGTTITFPMQLGGSYALPLGALLEANDVDFTGTGTPADPAVFTDEDGNIVSIVSDTNVSNARLSYTYATREWEVGVTEDGNEVTDTHIDVKLLEMKGVQSGGPMAEPTLSKVVYNVQTSGDPAHTLPAGLNEGVLHLIATGGSDTNYADITGPFRGEVRLQDGSIVYNSGANVTVRVRTGEQLTLWRFAGLWFIQTWDKWMHSGPNYLEEKDGTYTIFDFASFAGMVSEETGIVANLPFSVANPAGLHVQFTDAYGSAQGIGAIGTAQGNAAGAVYAHMIGDSTTTQIAAMFRDISGTAANPFGVHMTIKGAIRA